MFSLVCVGGHVWQAWLYSHTLHALNGTVLGKRRVDFPESDVFMSNILITVSVLCLINTSPFPGYAGETILDVCMRDAILINATTGAVIIFLHDRISFEYWIFLLWIRQTEVSNEKVDSGIDKIQVALEIGLEISESGTCFMMDQ